MDELEHDFPLLGEAAAKLSPATKAEEWEAFWARVQNLRARMIQASSFVGCLTAQNMKDKAAKLLEGRVKKVQAQQRAALAVVDGVLLQIPDSEWQALLQHDGLKAIAFTLNERRTTAQQKLPTDAEVLISDLSVDGYEAWGDMYYTVVSRMSIPFEENGETLELSMGQAANKLKSPDRAVRVPLFKQWEETWSSHADLFGHILNHLSGHRLQVYKHRGWDSVLLEPLAMNRMSAETLEAMWGTVEQNKGPFVEYLARKTKLLGLPAMSWHDLDAPIPGPARTYSYDEARAFIVEQFGKFSPDMAAFANHCFEQRWIEAEDRPGKRPGAFCTSFPVTKESRVFATFSGSADNVSTLGHEIGHAYHSYVLRDLPQFARGYAMNVAETASTFAETIIMDASVNAAQSEEERVALLDDKVQQSVNMFMNLHSRFLFETRFYDRRRAGLLSEDEISSLMEQAQKDAYHNALSEYHPTFWASKLHFYSTGVPFYNFPYTFGYLFSTGIYARAKTEGIGFAKRYVDLLRDTGRMTVEDLVQKHLGVDIRKPDFWQSAVGVTVADAKEFLRLTQ